MLFFIIYLLFRFQRCIVNGLIIYSLDIMILVVHWFEKKTQTTTQRVIDVCKKRLGDYDRG